MKYTGLNIHSRYSFIIGKETAKKKKLVRHERKWFNQVCAGVCASERVFLPKKIYYSNHLLIM